MFCKHTKEQKKLKLSTVEILEKFFVSKIQAESIATVFLQAKSM